MSWIGATTALTAGMGMIMWAGRERWEALLTAHTLGLMLWAFGLDTPLARVAALAILAAYGAGRLTLDLASHHSAAATMASARGVAALSLAAAPLTPGFVGVWLLGAALAGTGRPILAILLVGLVIVAACGAALHFGLYSASSDALLSSAVGGLSRWVASLAGGALLLGGVLPILWLPYVEQVTRIAGGAASSNASWLGLHAGPSYTLPLTPLAVGAALFVVIGWAGHVWAQRGIESPGVLLPPALERLMGEHHSAEEPVPALSSPPTAIWWLSFDWVERGLWGFGALVGRLSAWIGSLLGRVEGRYYLPLALIFALLTLLAVTR